MNVVRNEIRTGLLVLVSVAVLAAVLIYLGAPGLLRKMHRYDVYFDNAGGIQIGAPVMLGGRRVGQVTRVISPVPQNKRPKPNLETVVEVAVDRDARIYKKVNVSMLQYGLLGEQVIDFTAGAESSGLATSDTKFVGERIPGLNDAVPKVLEKLDPVVKSTTQTMEELRRTAEQLTALTSGSSDLTAGLASFKEFTGNMAELSGTEGGIQQTLSNLVELSGSDGMLQQTLGNLKEMTDETSPLNNAFHNAQEFTGNLARNKDLEKSLRSFRRAGENLNGAIRGIRPELKATAHNAVQFSDTLKHQPWRLIWPTTKKYPEDQPRPPAIAQRTKPRLVVKEKCVPVVVKEKCTTVVERERSTPGPMPVPKKSGGSDL